MGKPKTGANKSVTKGEQKLQGQNHWPYGTGRAKNWCEQIGHYNIVNSKTGANKLVTYIIYGQAQNWGKLIGHYGSSPKLQGKTTWPYSTSRSSQILV